MRDWLLKDEKAKVGRPKLANEEVLKKAKVSIALSLLVCFIMTFSFMSTLKGVSPFTLAYHLTLEKMFGALENKNGFIVKTTYDKDSNYVMEFSIPENVDRYSGSYKYTLYEMNGNSWIEKETKEIEKGTTNFKINIKSLKNKSKTWKIKFQIVNGSKIKESYAPFGWTFVDAEDNANMYAYKIFTVKGYYSPVSLDEIKESKKNKDKVTIITKKEDPRQFTLNLPSNNTYNVSVKYTDANAKKVLLADDKDVSGRKTYSIPNMNRITQVTFKIYSSNLDGIKLSNWKKETDKKGNSYITNTYVLKPEQTYKN